MKRLFLILAIAGSICACTGTTEKSAATDETAENEAAEAIVQEMDSVQAEIKTETEEALQEVDSLLNGI